jgi:hypothetical protein
MWSTLAVPISPGDALPDERKPTPRVHRRLGGALGQTLLVILGAALGGLFARNLQWFPPFQDASPRVFRGWAVSDPAAYARPEARLTAPASERIAYGSPLRVLGYCIGAATRDPVSGEFDQRWMVLQNGLLLAMPDGRLQPKTTLPLRGCVHEHDPIGGPHEIRLRAPASRGKITLIAESPRASTIGLALFEPRGKWRAVATLPGQTARVIVRPLGAVEAAAAPCWGPGAPAEPTETDETVGQLVPFARESAALKAQAAQLSRDGALAACSAAHYGVFPIHPPRRLAEPAPPRKKPTPALHSVAPAVPTYSPEPRPSATVAPEFVIPPKSRSSGAPQHQHTTLEPEESIGVGHRE